MAQSLPRRQTGGFTLLELLLALVLISLLALVAYAGLNLSLKAVGRGQEASLQAQQLRVGLSFVERSLASAAVRPQMAVKGPMGRRTRSRSGPEPGRPSPPLSAPGTELEPAYFVGQPQEIRFYTPVPLEAHNLGGLYHWRLFLATDEQGATCLAVEQGKILNWQRDPQGVELRVFMVRNVTALRFTYGAGTEEFYTWDGARQGRLPEWVRLNITLAGQKPRDWIIPLHVTEMREPQR